MKQLNAGKPADPPFEWTPEREEALKLSLAGFSQNAIAEKIGVHRNTISNWKAHPAFQAKLKEMNDEHVEATRQRRQRESNMFNDRIARMANKALDAAEKKPEDAGAQRLAAAWLQEYRAMRGEERQDSGDNVQRHEHSGNVQHNHTHSTRGMSMREFLGNALVQLTTPQEHNGKPILDLNDVPENPILALAAVAQTALIENDVMTDIAEEDRQEANAELMRKK